MRALLLTLAIFTTTSSLGDDFIAHPANPMVGRAIRDKTRPKKDTPTKPGSGKIVGHCVISGGVGSLRDEPCVEILLILKEKSGKPYVNASTDKNGNFMFEAAENTEYVIESGSKLVTVASPKTPVISGQSVNLKLIEK